MEKRYKGKVRMILTDGDGSLWHYDNKPFASSWDASAQSLSSELREKWFNLRDHYISPGTKINDTEWFKKQVKLLKGVSLEHINSFLLPIPYSSGAKEFFNSLNGDYVKGIVSSGMSLVANHAARELNFDVVRSNDIYVYKGVLTGTGKINVYLDKKDEAVRDVAKIYGINLEEVCFIGDNFNDIPALEIVGWPFVFNPKNESLKKYPVLEDYRQLLSLLNIKNKIYSNQLK